MLGWGVQVASSAVAAGGPVIWRGNVSTGNLSQFSYVEGCPGPNPPQSVSVVNSPTYPDFAHSVVLDVSDSDVTANCPGIGSPGHPSRGTMSPSVITPGNDYYIGFAVYFPSNFPRDICNGPADWWQGEGRYVPDCWFQVFEMYGRPFGGSPPVAIDVYGDNLVFNSAAVGVGSNGNLWGMPVPYGGWVYLEIHVHAATDSSGYVELWRDGVKQTFRNGSTVEHFANLMPGVNYEPGEADYADFDEYRGPNPRMGTVTIYDGAMVIASTQAGAADPLSGSRPTAPEKRRRRHRERNHRHRERHHERRERSHPRHERHRRHHHHHRREDRARPSLSTIWNWLEMVI